MKILFDYQAFNHQDFGGVSRYFAEIISGHPLDVNVETAIWRSNNIYLHQKNFLPNLLPEYNVEKHFIPHLHVKFKRNIFKYLAKIAPEHFPQAKYLNKMRAAVMVENGVFDIFHPTYFDPYFLKQLHGKPFVLTIHDMIDEVYHKGHLVPKYKALLARKASHIIAVSEHTKRDIIKILGIPEEKISVVYHACSLEESVLETTPQLPSQYILFVGGRERDYKRFRFFAKAVQPILEQLNVDLVCVGSPFSADELTFLNDNCLADRTHQLSPSDSELFYIYKNALCFVFPSVYEGFGIPILEAFKAGCPTVLSHSSCFPEIAKDAALYYREDDELSLQNCLLTLLNDKGKQELYRKKGYERLNDFSWSKAVDETYKIYDKVLSELNGQ